MPPTRSLCLTLLAIAACKGDRRAPSANARGVEPTAGAPATATADAACRETPVFPARSLGDGGNDLYRAIDVDDATHELFFTDLNTLYAAPSGGGEPRVAFARKGGMGRKLWLRPDRLLLPGSDMLLEPGAPRAVLYMLPRPIAAAGAQVADLQPILPLAVPGPTRYHAIENVRLSGDTAYWYTQEGERGTPDRTTTFFTTSWSQPGEPRALYTTTKRASYGDLMTPDFAVAGGKLYLTEETKSAGTEPQLVIDLETGARTSPPAALGGYVIGGDDRWIVVRHDGMTTKPMGAVRMRPDGSEPVQISESPHPRLAYGKDAWAIAATDFRTSITDVATIDPATGARTRLGCIASGGTIHAIALGADAVYVSLFRNQKATILRFAR